MSKYLGKDGTSELISLIKSYLDMIEEEKEDKIPEPYECFAVNTITGYRFVNGPGETLIYIDGNLVTLAANEEISGDFENDIQVVLPYYYLKEVYINGDFSYGIQGSSISGQNETLEKLEVCFSKDYRRDYNFQYSNSFRYNSVLNYLSIEGSIATYLSQAFSYNGCERVFLDINTSECEEFNGCFRNCPNLKELDLTSWDMQKCTLFNAFARECPNLTTVMFGECNLANCTNVANAFYNCPSLRDITGNIVNIPNDLNFADSPLSRSSALVIINGLMDYSNGDSHTMSFSDYTKSLLTDEDIKIATDKNWVI